jgi:dTDP-4-amino-4,6-dideoxy-D-galactose acyltransferase
MAETSHRFRDLAVDIAVMTTQATNRAVIHNSERLGYRLGRTTHIFAAYGPAAETG